MSIYTTLDEYIREQHESYTLTIEDKDYEYYTTVTALKDGVKVAAISSQLLFDKYMEFDGDLPEDEIDSWFPGDIIVRIEQLNVYDSHRRDGIGTTLVNKLVDVMKKRGYNQFYLNAYPLGAISLTSLVGFYQKCGFRILLHQNHNVLMVKVI